MEQFQRGLGEWEVCSGSPDYFYCYKMKSTCFLYKWRMECISRNMACLYTFCSTNCGRFALHYGHFAPFCGHFAVFCGYFASPCSQFTSLCDLIVSLYVVLSFSYFVFWNYEAFWPWLWKREKNLLFPFNISDKMPNGPGSGGKGGFHLLIFLQLLQIKFSNLIQFDCRPLSLSSSSFFSICAKIILLHRWRGREREQDFNTMFWQCRWVWTH